jgi:hypothetical protein
MVACRIKLLASLGGLKRGIEYSIMLKKLTENDAQFKKCGNGGIRVEMKTERDQMRMSSDIKPLQTKTIRYNQNPMEDHEREGTFYILAIIGFILSILILVSLTHVILP